MFPKNEMNNKEKAIVYNECFASIDPKIPYT